LLRVKQALDAFQQGDGGRITAFTVRVGPADLEKPAAMAGKNLD
jgi:hypothetical protein